MTWRPGNDAPESWKIRWEIVEYTRGRGLDLGCGMYKPWPHLIGVDNNVDAELFDQPATAADIIIPTCEKLDIFATHSMDFVFSSHLLEHIQDYERTLHEWWRVVRPGGYLILYLPHKDHYPNIGTGPLANPDHKHDFVNEDIAKVMLAHKLDKAELVRDELRIEGTEYSFFQVWRKVGGCKDRSVEAKPGQTTIAVCRLGAFGDCIQASSLLPALKEMHPDSHLTFICVQRGYDVLKNDPHIDKFILLDENQVPPHVLGDFFDKQKERYTHWVNLSGIVEGHLLPARHLPHFGWSKEALHTVCNFNYVETMHKAYGIPYTLRSKFYATDAERAWAGEKRRMHKGKVIVWSLSGSSVHKVWPHVDSVVAAIMIEYPDAHVYLVGGPEEEPLGDQWRNEKRVHSMMGKWSIRETLAFAQRADLVIGPETGVLNGVATESNAKVLFLSHSTTENLCRDWTNTMAIAPVATHCYPCHKLHLTGFDTCNRHPEGGALCAVNITPDVVMAGVRRALGNSA